MSSGRTTLTVDTNVFVYSNNKCVSFHDASKVFLNQLLESDVRLVVDEGYHSDPAQNTSRIGHEYLAYVAHGSFGFYVLLRIVQEGRMEEARRGQFTKYKRCFRQLVRDKADIIFLSVAASTQDRTLVSNDYQDMQKSKRRKWRKANLVCVLGAHETIV